jgi:hypothetical protein
MHRKSGLYLPKDWKPLPEVGSCLLCHVEEGPA